MKTAVLGLIFILSACSSEKENGKAATPPSANKPATANKPEATQAAVPSSSASPLTNPDMIAICNAAGKAKTPMNDEERHRFLKELPVADAKIRESISAIQSAPPNQVAALMGAIAKEAGEKNWNCPAFDALLKK